MVTDSNQIIRQFDLLGKLVINRETTEELGQVDQLWLDLKHHQVMGLTSKAGVMGLRKYFLTWTQIETIGAAGLMVSLPAGLESTKPEDLETVIGHEVWTEAGDKVGSIRDYRLHPETGDIIDYLFVSNGWRGLVDETYCLLPAGIVSIGRKRMIVTVAAIQHAEQFDGLSKVVAQVGNFLKGDFQRTRQDMNAALQGTQAIANQLTSQTKGKLLDVAGQLQQATDKLRDKAPEQRLEEPEILEASGSEDILTARIDGTVSDSDTPQ
jgi:uncharacterized protein YrrD